MDQPASTPEEWLAHAQWLRRLALRLAGDESTADDLVQETWLAALRRPPRANARAWLARVLTNAARQRRRTAARRVGRELGSAERRAEVLSPEELAERLELEQRLLSAVAELRDPYKTVVLLRYEEGLSTGEIARLRGVPGATVRTQLHRAVAELRKRMDEEAGGRAAWVALLAPEFAGPKAGGALAAAEVIGMSSTSKVGLAGAAVVLALVGVWSVSGWAGGGEPVATNAVTRVHEPATASEPEAAPTELGPPPGAEAEREAIATPGAEPSELWVLAARVVDRRGGPIDRARLSWNDEDGDERSASSAADGQVELALERTALAGRGALRVEADGYLPLEIEVAPDDSERDGDGRTWLGDIALEGGATLAGSVVDGLGRAVADATVHLTWAPSLGEDLARARRQGPGMGDLWEGAHEVRTDANGRFELHSFETGTRMLWAVAAETLWTLEGPFEIAAGQSREVELVLETAGAELRISGVVLDPSGQPVPAAHLWYFDDPGRGKKGATADADGRFDLLLDVDRSHVLRAVDPEERFAECVLEDVVPGTDDVVLQFAPSRQLTVMALDPSGRLLEVTSMFATNSADNNIIASGEVSGEPESGAALLEPAEDFLVKVRAAGHAEGVFGPFAPGALPERVEFSLTAVAEVLGTVRHAGEPVPGAQVDLYWAIGQNQVVYHRGVRALHYPFSFDEEVTDDEGHFAMTPRDNTHFFIRVSAEGLAPAVQEVAAYDPQVGVELEFDLTAGATIEGVVVPRPGEQPTGLVVVANCGDANELTHRLGPDGAFRFERVRPGRWLVEVVADDMSEAGATFLGSNDPPELDWNVEVQDGEEAFLEIDLADAARAVLDGVLRIDGRPAEGWTAALRPMDRPSGRPNEFPQAVLDAGGQFHLETPVEGPQTLRLTAPEGAFPCGLRVAVELVDGQSDWSLALETGAVVLRGVPSAVDDHYRPHLMWRGPDGLTSRLDFERDADGNVRIERVPAGTLELRDHPQGPRTAAETRRSVDLAPGAALEIDW